MPTVEDLRYFQRLPLDIKVAMTKARIREWVNHYGINGVYISMRSYNATQVIKTGRNFPQMVEMMKEMRDNDG